MRDGLAADVEEVRPVNAVFRAARAALDRLFPAYCLVCGRSAAGGRDYLCPHCREDLRPFDKAACLRCAEPLRDASSPVCPECLRSPPAFSACRAAALYAGTARRVVTLLKRSGKLALLDGMAQAMVRCMPLAGGCGGDSCVVVPVPPRVSTRFRRGFSPALELARRVGGLLSLPVRETALRRRWCARSQKTLSRSRRLVFAQRAFAAGPGRLDGKTVLLVDDVLTTGATASACSRLLREQGARDVQVLVFARTPRA